MARYGSNYQTAIARSARVQTKDGLGAINRHTVIRFFSGAQNISFPHFESICECLGLEWDEVSDRRTYRYQQPTRLRNQNISLDDLVKHTRHQVASFINYECGSIAPFGGQVSINRYVELRLFKLRFLPSEEVLTHEALRGEIDQKNFDRLGISLQDRKPLDGRQAVMEHERLLVYGGPGTGKTSYLKWIAIQCNKGLLLPDFVPVFLKVKSYALDAGHTSLHTTIEKFFTRNQVEQATTVTRTLLEQGRILLILDGLDEVPENLRPNIQQNITELLDRYYNCRFVFSCRLPLSLPFKYFQLVLTAPFSVEQTVAFARRWFDDCDESSLSDRFCDRLPKHITFGELTRTPLLLELLCRVFRKNEKFPLTRADVYELGLRSLLQEEQHQLQRSREFQNITTHDIRAVLGKIAADFFLQPQPKILLETRAVERKIEEYFNSLSALPFRVRPSALLDGIEMSFGLLVKHSSNFCTFSHLTFQEFFVAEHLVQTNQQSIVYSHITEHQWRFVIELVAELLPAEKIAAFFDEFKAAIDRLVIDNAKIREFLTWVNQTAALVAPTVQSQIPYQQTLLRAWYFTFTLEDVFVVSNPGHQSQSFMFPDFDFATSTLTSKTLEVHSLFYRAYHAAKSASHCSSFLRIVDHIYETFQKENPWLQNQLHSWLETIQLQQQHHRHQEEWWDSRREYWMKRLGLFMQRHHNLRCDWQFTEDEKRLLRQYYDVTKLMSICLNRSQEVSGAIYQEVVNNMLYLTAPLPEEEFVGF